MSIVIAYKKDNVVYMGADTKRSQGNWARTIETVNDMKIHKIGENMLIGAVGTLSNIQTLINNREEWFDTKGKPLTKKFIVQNVIPKFFHTLKREEKITIEEGKSPKAKCCFCITDGKKIFHIDDFFVVTELSDFCAIGCTEYIAYAYIRNANKNDNVKDIILSALRGSVYRDDGVGAPYIFIDTDKFEFSIVEK